MRLLLLPIVALAALVAHQRPDWIRALDAGARRVAAEIGDLGSGLGIGPERGSIAARAKAAEPDRATALAVLGRAAEARQDAFAAEPGSGEAARERVQALLRSAAATMAGSEALGELRAMQDARTRVAELRERAAQARIAGGDASDLEARLSQAGAEAGRSTDAFVEKLAGIGVHMPREAAEGLSLSVNGDDVVALLGAYANVERLEAGLRQAVSGAQDNEAAVRRYYAIHAALLGVLEAVQGEAVSRIENLYLPRLDAVGRETRELRQDAQARLRQIRDPGLRASLDANLRTQELTLRATELYRRHLQDQRSSLSQALDRTRAALAVADNTARTASLALDVAAMVRNTDRDFGAVMAVRPPVVVPFEGEALRREFEGLSRRLGQGPTS
jgi:hypothetical protein